MLRTTKLLLKDNPATEEFDKSLRTALLQVGKAKDQALAEKQEKEGTRTMRPMPSQMEFTFQPASKVNFDKVKKETEKASDKRFASFAKKNQSKNFNRTTKMSIEGRGL